MAPRRKAVASCQALSLKTLEKATGNYIKQATEDFVLAENLLENSIKKVQAYLFHSIPRCLCAQVAKSFINALTSWLKLSIKISTKLTNEHTGEFNDSMYVGLRLAEVIANNHVDHLDLSQARISYQVPFIHSILKYKAVEGLGTLMKWHISSSSICHLHG